MGTGGLLPTCLNVDLCSSDPHFIGFGPSLTAFSHRQLNSKSDGVYYGIIPLSGQFEQLLFIKNPDGTTSFAFADELIAHYAASIFNKSTLQNACLFRVTRNADITVDEGMMDHDIDFRDVMSELLKKRRKLAAVRLQFWPSAPQEIVKFLLDKLVVPADRCYTQTSPLDPGLLFRLASRVSADSNPAFSYPPARPIQAPADYDLYAEAHKHDVLLSYPYQSIRPFIRMLMKAGSDPDVVSIKMTLYRMASDSHIIPGLMRHPCRQAGMVQNSLCGGYFLWPNRLSRKPRKRLFSGLWEWGVGRLGF